MIFPESYSFIATAAFGLEGVVAGELKRMGISAKAEQGGARFNATLTEAYRAQLWLRTADRVLMVLGEGEVYSFEDLFQRVASIAWEKYIPSDAAFPVSGKCVRSQLMSVRDCQAVSKKAICNRLASHYSMQRFPENGVIHPIDVAIHRDVARITLDMSGEALNRRGYRTWNGEAPLRETLAAALVDISPWRVGMPLYDPCCGTGTLLIEAAMKATHCAPGLRRAFACDKYKFMPFEDIQRLRNEAEEFFKPEASLSIAGSDIDSQAIQLCERHIHQAGFKGKLQVSAAALQDISLPEESGVFLCNPPYGERLGEKKECQALYRDLGAMLRRHPGWKMGVIASDPAFERFFGRRATRKRRLYNGRLECEFFVFDA